MPICYIGFGSNLGDRLGYILGALEGLMAFGEIKKVSTVYESQPWGPQNQGSFLNGVLELETWLNPIDLLRALKSTEQKLGRRPRERWGPREIDLDILLYENHIIMLSFLKVPHPYLTQRDFVLFPLLEVAPELIHPLSGKRLEDYALNLQNRLVPYICILPSEL
ncbi:MAG: 2-amino-4-hydroxy-6-hydroxymethyldihydropteridine diphosphokinase [Acidobacteria bacterium]|jgi:2-amino-4-hydroxy-6-hydroxymethyldihydropteridine diphosphokinase|nr:MAG: 2-amino-4-hydroxy-6-hydroxymethyldihydropteridine diphosphokinase [Acidobacteriota bacterium]